MDLTSELLAWIEKTADASALSVKTPPHDLPSLGAVKWLAFLTGVRDLVAEVRRERKTKQAELETLLAEVERLRGRGRTFSEDEVRVLLDARLEEAACIARDYMEMYSPDRIRRLKGAPLPPPTT